MEKSELLSIVENEFAIPKGVDYHELLPVLESNLGSTDTVIRENSMEILYNWAAKGMLTDLELIDLGHRLAANLSYKLGESETDSVFLRSFSALVLNGVLRADRNFIEGKIEGRKSFLTSDLINNWLNLALEYFINEQDLRGYVPIKEWAHSLAHCSDLFCSFAHHPIIRKEDHLRILDVIATKFLQPANHVFTASEEARICRVIAAIQTRCLVLPEEYQNWLKKIITPYAEKTWFEDVNEPETFNQKLNARVNARLFLQRLYDMLQYNVEGISKTQEEVYNNILQYRESLTTMITQGFKKMGSSSIYNQ
ncbi:MAG: DUF2785 domain-containing protein [Asgard group archaeon]|nr:DUF2785 domain-containing protein [Asgard group archaeon]